MKTVVEMHRKYGVSSRTLQYYDQIGLLKPSNRIGNQNTKVYGEIEERRLVQILRYKEAGIPLKSIKIMLDAEPYVQIEIIKTAINKNEDHISILKQQIDSAKLLIREIEISKNESKK